jgi:transposase
MFTSRKVMSNRKVMPNNDRDLTNAQWEILDSLIPQPTPRSDGRGRPWKDRRAVLNGILWILRTSAPWADVPRNPSATESKSYTPVGS